MAATARAFIASIKRNSVCHDCKQSFHPAAMEFDHLPGSEKKFNLGNIGRRSLGAFKKEIKKCQIVCANCHRVRTEERRKQVAIPIEMPSLDGVSQGSLF